MHACLFPVYGRDLGLAQTWPVRCKRPHRPRVLVVLLRPNPPHIHLPHDPQPGILYGNSRGPLSGTMSGDICIWHHAVPYVTPVARDNMTHVRPVGQQEFGTGLCLLPLVHCTRTRRGANPKRLAMALQKTAGL